VWLINYKILITKLQKYLLVTICWENFAFLGFYAVILIIPYRCFGKKLSGQTSRTLEEGPIVCPERLEGINSTHCITAQKRAILIYFAAEARNHAKYLLLRITSPACFGLWRPNLQKGLRYKVIYFYTNVVKDVHK
jgi:hypothetical protein